MSTLTTSIVRGAQFLPKYHRPWFRYIDGPDAGEGGDGSEGTDGEGKSFTQDDVNKLVAKARNEERRKASERYSDYEDLKTRAEGSRTLEERIATLETEGTKSTQRALRAEIAAEFGISTKKGGDKGDQPSEAELFLTGADEATLRQQAKALADMAAAKKKQNVAPKEGGTQQNGDQPNEIREFARDLFGGDD